MALRQEMLFVVRTDKTGLAGTTHLLRISFLLEGENQEESFFFLSFFLFPSTAVVDALRVVGAVAINSRNKIASQ